MHRGAALAIYLAATLLVARAQEIDTALAPAEPHKTTVLDQIADRTERRDFEKFYAAKDPLHKHTLAQQFLSAHPQSWFLAEAYEAAAKASIDLGQFDQSLAEAKLSLRLFPENPLLLVPVANVEAQLGLSGAAERDAQRALDLLDQFGFDDSESAGDSLNRRLASSARFALARVYAARALAQQAADRKALLQRAFDQLTLAGSENRKDGEIFLLRGIVRQAEGKALQAASDFRQAGVLDDGLRPIVLQHLREVYAMVRATSPADSLDTFIKNLPAPADESAKSIASSPLPLGRYAGSAACRECHRSEYEAWRQTGMSRMLRPYVPANVFGDFRSGTVFRGESGPVIAKMGSTARGPYMELRSADGVWNRYFVAYTIGSKWQQAYVVEGRDGRLQVLPIQYNRLEARWLNYWRLIDPPGSVRADPLQFSRLSPDTNYQLNCAICHTSQLKAESPAQPSLEQARFREPGINCEMCHGPSQKHVDKMRGASVGGERDKLPVDFTRIGNREGVAICAQCHRQSALQRANALGELNYSSTGETFVQRTATRPYSEFLRRAFYKDGRFRETTFIVEAFERSQCYQKGSAQCASCHDPHPGNAAANPVSLKFPPDSNRMCLQCHSSIGLHLEAHTHHAASSEASRCVSCHMPRIMNSLRFQARSHQIDDIPDAAMTARFGQEQSPNACLLCHKDRDAGWTSAELAKWSFTGSARR